MKLVFDFWKDGLFIKLGCLCSRLMQILVKLVLHDYRNHRKIAVVFAFSQEVETLS